MEPQRNTQIKYINPIIPDVAVPAYPGQRYETLAPDTIDLLKFPISEMNALIYVEKRTYRIHLRGNTCIAIDPPGRNLPLFEREYLRSDLTRWRSIQRFVADQQIIW
jgi:hypothetical protein